MESMLQMIRKARDPAELRQLLKEQGLAEDDILAFEDEDLQHLLDKGLRTPGTLLRATRAVLERPPPLPPIQIEALLEKFNPAALTAGPGGWPRAAQAGCAGAV